VAKCNRCGQQITFRKVDGKTIPIHLNGRCTGGYGGRPVRYITQPVAAKEIFDEPRSYLNPNAKCPVCGKSVFFFQSEYGGRVFFDDVGWPWPKHPCTDHAVAQHNTTIYAPSGTSTGGSTDWTKNYTFFKLISVRLEGGRLYLRLKEITKGFMGFFRSLISSTERTYSFSESNLEKADVQEGDFRKAPSFLIEKTELTSDRAIIQFICPRKGKIMRVRMRFVDGR
jgi:predicted RNA-binding Zn-ribbon protein involved in translation (DUF1610 family)